MKPSCGSDAPHVGVVFAHGIGSQQPGETLRDWSAPLIGLLGDWRLEHGVVGDPVIGAQIQSADGTGLFIEVELPVGDLSSDGPPLSQAKTQHWIFTEAWWAGRVVAPTFPDMASWLGNEGAIARIGEAFVSGGRRPEATSDEEAADAAAASSPVTKIVAKARQAGFHTPTTVVLSAMAALILVVYGAIRVVSGLIPVASVKDRILGSIDNFVLNWFGDVHVLLGDYAQSAGVRAQLAESLAFLQRMGCSKIVLVAHSGGAIVSYLTLCDDQYKDLQVDHLVTLGEGLNLAWEVTGADESKPNDNVAKRRFGRLLDTPLTNRPELLWTDFWASKDPAPLGSMRLPGGLKTPKPSVRDVDVWNRLSSGDDHGSYWSNDEEFVIPLAQIIEQTGSPGAEPRLYPEELRPADADTSDIARTRRGAVRRERVWMLGLWNRAMLAFPIFAIAIAAIPLYATNHSVFLVRLGSALSDVILKIPGADLVDGVLITIRSMDMPPLIQVWAVLGVAEIAVVITGGLLLVLKPLGYGTIWRERRSRSIAWLDGLFSVIGYLLFLIYCAISAYFIVGQMPAGATLVSGFVLAVNLVVFLGPVLARLGRRLDGNPVFPFVSAFLGVSFGSIAVLAPLVAILIFANFARMVVALAAIAIAFEVIRRLGAWRWNAWDVRERRAARRVDFVPRQRSEVGIQAMLLTLAAFGLLVSVTIAGVLDHEALQSFFHVPDDLAPVVAFVAVVLSVLVVLFGVSLDAAEASAQESAPGGTIGRFASSMTEQTVERSTK